MNKLTAFLMGLGASVAAMLAVVWRKKGEAVVKATERAQDAEAKDTETKVTTLHEQTLSAKEAYEAAVKSHDAATTPKPPDSGTTS